MSLKFKYFTKPNFTVTEVEPSLHKKSKIWFRPNTSDLSMIKDCMKNYSAINYSHDDIVLDLGSNIGTMAKIALDAGVKQVITLEADLFNYELVCHNLKEYNNVINIHAAVVGNDKKESIFVIKDNKNSACSGKVVYTDKNISKSLYHTQVIKSINFNELLFKYKPTIIKIDIEGFEYDIIKSKLPDFVKLLAIEFHGMNKEQFIKMFNAVAYFNYEWEPIMFEPEFIFNSLALTNAVYYRKQLNSYTDDLSNIQIDLLLERFNHVNLNNLKKLKHDSLSINKKNTEHYNTIREWLTFFESKRIHFERLGLYKS